MPSSARYSRALTGSPPSSAASLHAHTLVGNQPVKVVTRLALEGKARTAQDGASMRMYLKMSVPVEHATPGSTIPLFPEENVKILNSQVHPLDSNSAPYHFSSSNSPLLHNAARALNLPARSSQSYLSLFNLHYPSHSPPSVAQSPPSITNSSRSSSSSGTGLPALEEKYTGHILVTGYQVSYVLPKEFPSRYGFGDSEDPRASPLSSRRASRRGSVGDRPTYQFMAAIELWVPLLTKPPRAPYLLSIPVPRCLSNTLNLRINPPTSTSISMASLSSADDEGQWDLTCHPHLTRNASRHSRSTSYALSQLADDESSDSSTKGAGYSEGSGLQGTFQSTGRLRIRWARADDMPSAAVAGRRRVGVIDAKGELTATVLGKGKARDDGVEGTLVRLEYKGVCKNVWYAGVATLLGLDVGVEARECGMRWPEGSEPGWTVTGEAGFTGWDVGEERVATAAKPFLYGDPSLADQSIARQRIDSSGSTASLLRAPLPANHVSEYSFESVNSTPVSSTSSLPPPSPGLERSITPNGMDPSSEPDLRPPGVPITVHVNMDDLLPPTNQSNFTFQVSGTVIVLPRADIPLAPGLRWTVPQEISLPRFSVLAANTEIMQTLIRNEARGMTLDVLSASEDDRAVRKTLPHGAHARCGADGARVVLRPINAPSFDMDAETPQRRRERSMSRPGTPKRRLSSASMSHDFLTSEIPAAAPARPKRDGPLMIPHVDVGVDLFNRDGDLQNAYTVRLELPAPDDSESEWLEFGLSTFGAATLPQSVRFACASVEGVPVHLDVAEGAVAGHDKNGVPTANSQKWLRWVKVHTAGHRGARVRVDYTVYPPADKEGSSDAWPWEFLLLPVFTLPTGPYQVRVEKPKDCFLEYRYNAFSHHHHTAGDGMKFRTSRAPEYFEPKLTLHAGVSHEVTLGWSTLPLRFIRAVFSYLPSLLLLAVMLQMRSELQDLRAQINSGLVPTPPQPTAPAEPVVETITIINTHYTHPPWASKGPAVLVDSPPAPSAAETPIPSTPPLSVDIPVDPSPSPIPTPTTHASLPTVTLPAPTCFPPPDHTLAAAGGLIPLYAHLPWKLKIDWDLPTTEDVSRNLMQGVGKVWQVFRRMYHYPLPPP